MHDYERFARWYDEEFGAIDDDLPMWERFAREAGDCLELGCGTGRCAIAIARAGIPVVGIDLSPCMLEIARRKLEGAGLSDRVRLVAGDMRDFSLDRDFALAIVPFGSLMCLETHDEQRAAIACAARHLRAGGEHVLHARTMRHDRAMQILHVEERFRETNAEGTSTVTTLALPLRYLRPSQLEGMTRAAGLDVDAIFGTYALDRLEAASPRIVFVARQIR